MGHQGFETHSRQPVGEPWPWSRNYGRLLLAFFVAAITPGLLIGVGFSVPMVLANPLGLLALYVLPPVAAVFGLFTTVPTILIAGIPAYLLCSWLGRTDWPTYVVGGAVIGWAVVLILAGNRGYLESAQSTNVLGWIGVVPPAWQLGFALLGAVSASMFWFVLHTRRAEQAFLAKAAVVSLAAIGLALFLSPADPFRG